MGQVLAHQRGQHQFGHFDELDRLGGYDYASGGKPSCDWDDPAAREALVDELAKDAYACLEVLDGRELAPGVAQAAELLATVVGQDLEAGDDGAFRIARKVAQDRVISVVDPDARHGHKTSARKFDGYKGHVAVDPDSEVITATVVTPGNAGDASAAADLIDDLLADDDGNGLTMTMGQSPRCTAITLMGPESSSPSSKAPTSPRGARPSRPARQVGCSPRTASI